MEGIWQIKEWSFDAQGLSLIAILLSCMLLLSLLYLLRPLPKLPPGPFGLPLLGHLHLLGSHPHRSFARMSHRYGPLFYLKLGSIPCIVASTPEAAREILRAHDQTFAYRMRVSAADHIYGTCRGILMSEPGPFWRFFRQICATELFNFRSLERFEAIREEEVRALLRLVYADATQPATNGLVHLLPRLQEMANTIISRMAVGDASCVLLQPVLKAVEAIVAVNVGDYFPWIQWADLQGCVKHSKKVGLQVRGALQQVMEQRREQQGGVYEPPTDLLDILLSAALTCPKNLQLTDDHIKAVLVDIFAGGTDSSAVVLEWAMAELLASPTQMRQAREEIENVVSANQGNKMNMVKDADIQKMPFVQAVVKETLRLHPVAPLLFPRVSRKACQVMGFEIPANTHAFVNVWAIGKDPKLWDNPNDFRPQRFLDSNIDVRGQHFELLPFGAGRRICPGLNLGLLTVHNILASLLHSFSWTTHDIKHDMSESKLSFLNAKAVPLRARATPNFHSQFYD